ncbi:unnamed protein product [Albugo candida]|uniref:Uncharacterized protein n=1 Tax=Albugo candida TaxID=65357 RepID=A0A024GRS7_9STRA|nr:unnamed protein product [Albugo candida]|eukprot:CCI49065.1 unnamed protein product [Albugo candida]
MNSRRRSSEESFSRILHSTQSIDFHEWNIESLDRALDWANAVDASDSTTSKSGTEKLLRWIMQSAYLSTHPMRSEILQTLVQKAAAQFGAMKVLRSSLIRAMNDKSRSLKLDSLLEQVRVHSHCCQFGSTVLLGDERVRITSPASYFLLQRSLQFARFGDCILKNINIALGQSLETYHDIMKKLRCHFDQNGEFKEVVAVMLLSENSSADIVKQDIMSLFRDWIIEKPTRFWSFDPWLSASILWTHNERQNTTPFHPGWFI